MSKELSDKVISGECPSCLEEVEFKYIGPQEGKNEMMGELYNCLGCNGTLELSSIKQYNQNLTQSSQ